MWEPLEKFKKGEFDFDDKLCSVRQLEFGRDDSQTLLGDGRTGSILKLAEKSGEINCQGGALDGISAHVFQFLSLKIRSRISAILSKRRKSQ